MKSLRIGTGLAALAILLMLPGAGRGRTSEGRFLLRYVLNGDAALLLNRPELICGGEVKEMQWSPDGEFAVAVHDAPPAYDSSRPEAQAAPVEVSATVWRHDIHRTRTIWRSSLMYAQIGMDWLPHSSIGLLNYSAMDAKGGRVYGLLMLLPQRDTVREVPVRGQPIVNTSPMQPLAVINEEEFDAQKQETKSHLRIFGIDGAMRDAQEPPNPAADFIGWSPNGKTCYTRSIAFEKGKKPVRSYFALDTASGAWTPLKEEPVTQAEKSAESAAPKSDLRIVLGSSVIEQDGVKKTVHPAWLASRARNSPPRVLIAADCEEAILSPKGDAVLYRTQEGAFVLPLTRIPALAFTEMLKQAAMSNAKQIGLGLIQYVQDYDEAFPLATFNISEVVNPYVKNSDLFEGFTYAYPAKGLASVANPATTIMGTVSGPGGEAVIYVDGHVKWRDVSEKNDASGKK